MLGTINPTRYYSQLENLNKKPVDGEERRLAMKWGLVTLVVAACDKFFKDNSRTIYIGKGTRGYYVYRGGEKIYIGNAKEPDKRFRDVEDIQKVYNEDPKNVVGLPAYQLEQKKVAVGDSAKIDPESPMPYEGMSIDVYDIIRAIKPDNTEVTPKDTTETLPKKEEQQPLEEEVNKK